jgi:hypothetical protein
MNPRLLFLLFIYFIVFTVVNADIIDSRLNRLVFDKNNTYETEMVMMQKEFERANDMFATLKKRGYTIAGFYHTSTWREKWREVITDQLKILDGYRKIPLESTKGTPVNDITEYEWHNTKWTSLLNASSELYVNVAGNIVSNLKLQ